MLLFKLMVMLKMIIFLVTSYMDDLMLLEELLMVEISAYTVLIMKL
jgi:hypothetical protein